MENRTGANGNIGTEAAAKSAPDGYTLLVAPEAVASNLHVYKVNYELKDLAPVIQLSRQPVVLAAHPTLGVKTIAELIAHVKKNPGERFATGSGTNSGQHMVTLWFAKLAGIELEQVSYRGGGQAINDLLAGHVKLGTLGSTPLIPHYRAGKLLLLAQTTAARAASLPDVPTFQESGMKGLVFDQWLGVFVPAGTPQPIVARLNAEIGKALSDPAIKGNLEKSAQEPIGGTAEAFAKLVQRRLREVRTAGEGPQRQRPVSGHFGWNRIGASIGSAAVLIVSVPQLKPITTTPITNKSPSATPSRMPRLLLSMTRVPDSTRRKNARQRDPFPCELPRLVSLNGHSANKISVLRRRFGTNRTMSHSCHERGDALNLLEDGMNKLALTGGLGGRTGVYHAELRVGQRVTGPHPARAGRRCVGQRRRRAARAQRCGRPP